MSLIVEISCNRKKLFKLQVLTQLAEIISVKKGHLMVIYLACCKNLINIFLMCRYAWLLWFSWGLLSKESWACLHFSSFWSSWSACWAACKVVWLLCCWKCWKQRKGDLLNMSARCFNSINFFSILFITWYTQSNRLISSINLRLIQSTLTLIYFILIPKWATLFSNG